MPPHTRVSTRLLLTLIAFVVAVTAPVAARAYVPDPGDGGMSIASTSLTVTADNRTVTYGDAVPTGLTFTLTGAFDSGHQWGTEPTCTTTYAQGDSAGTKTGAISCSGGTIVDTANANADVTANYVITYVAGDLVVDPRPITVTADDATVTYGGAKPPVGYTITSGSLYGSDDWSTEPSCTTTYAPGDAVGTQTDANSCSGGVISNYTVTYATGDVTVNPRPITVTANDKTVTYGSIKPTIGYTITSGSLYGTDDWSTEPSCTTTYTQGDTVGTQTDANSCSGGVISNYTVTYATGDITVDPRPITVTADDKSVTYGGPKPTIGFTITSGSFYGSEGWGTEPSCSTAYTKGDPAGTTPISCSGGTVVSGATDVTSQYDIRYVDGDLTVTPVDLGHDAAWYTGQTTYYTRSASDTAVQVTLRTSVTAESLVCADGTSVADGVVTFTDADTGKVLARNVAIAPFGNDCTTGEAVAIATLSTGPALMNAYRIAVTVNGSITGDNGAQNASVDAAIVTVSVPPVLTGGLSASGDFAHIAGSSSTDLGTTGRLVTTTDGAVLRGTFTYRKGTTPKGRAFLYIPGVYGTTPGMYVAKTTSITSTTADTGAKRATVYAKTSIEFIPTGCLELACHAAVDGGASFQLDLDDASNGNKAAVTILATKTSALQFSNHWVKLLKAWKSQVDPLSGDGPAVVVS